MGVTELEGDSDGPASMRAMTLRFVRAVGVDCDMVDSYLSSCQWATALGSNAVSGSQLLARLIDASEPFGGVAADSI